MARIAMAAASAAGPTTPNKGPMALGDPFAAFLAVRRAPAPQLDPAKMQPLWPSKEAPDTAVPDGDLALDPFASFVAMRPPRPSPPVSIVEQSLREDLLRTKRRLLEVGLKAEITALDPSCPPDTATRLRRLRKAQRYLQHPERTLEAMSGAVSEASGDEPDPQTSNSLGGTSSLDLAPKKEYASVSPRISDGTGGRNTRSCQRLALPRPPGLSTSSSMPNLSEEAHTHSRTRTLDTPILPPIGPGTQHTAPMSTRSAFHEDKTPLLQAWWSRTRSWNVGFNNKDLTAGRHNLSMSGGTVVLGNGRLPLFTGSHLLSSGFFYSFQVDALDDEHFPLKGLRDLTFGFGVSRCSPHHRSCERPVFAYEIPDAVLLGYGDHLIDKNKWWHTDWNPRELQEKDIVGVLVAPDGDIVIFVNGLQVLRVPTSLAEDGDFTRSRSSQRRTLYPVVDLHGRVAAVTLLPRQSPPNKPLQCRNRLR